MANLGNAWHLPDSPEPRGRGGMRDPVGVVVAGAALTIRGGNQFAGPGNAADQLQDGSVVLARRIADQDWTTFPLLFSSQVGNNKYFEASIPPEFLVANDTVSYVLSIAYGDRDTTFVHAAAGGSVVTDTAADAQAAPFTFTVVSPGTAGRWDPVLALPDVAVHAALLPTGQIQMWGRRVPGDPDMNVQATAPFRWDPTAGVVPADGINAALNLFCSGHAFLPDGTLLVAGGHDQADGHGLATAFRYDPAHDSWTPLPLMNNGRWYPTATALPDGAVLVTSGSFAGPQGTTNNLNPQAWQGGAWTPVAPLPDGQAFELYPRMHVAPSGSIVMTGPQAGTWWLDPSGTWATGADRPGGRRDYAPSVQYQPDRIIYLGGGNDTADDPGGGAPTTDCEVLQLDTVAASTWAAVDPMSFARRHHNATMLPDGTVLVTGGTQGASFNNLDAGAPVHQAELWDHTKAPGSQWATMAAELIDRCYHSVAVLLPDGRVFSAGGGEFLLDNQANDPQDTHADAQLYSPPYLFAGPRPGFTTAPATIDHATTFTVQATADVPVDRVSLVRLGSVTHAQTLDQRFLWLDASVTGTAVTVTAPANPQLCPPGPYLLFLLSPDGVPSVGAIVRVTVPLAQPAALRRSQPVEPRSAAPTGTAVVVGIDGVCPYGIGACWGGANEALHRLTGVAGVDPVPDEVTGTAVVHLSDDGLPALDVWDLEFPRTVNGSYTIRGYEISLRGVLDRRAGVVLLRARPERPQVLLGPLSTLVQWDRQRGTPQQPSPTETDAYSVLADLPTGAAVHVTGPLTRDNDGYHLHVRLSSPSP